MVANLIGMTIRLHLNIKIYTWHKIFKSSSEIRRELLYVLITLKKDEYLKDCFYRNILNPNWKLQLCQQHKLRLGIRINKIKNKQTTKFLSRWYLTAASTCHMWVSKNLEKLVKKSLAWHHPFKMVLLFPISSSFVLLERLCSNLAGQLKHVSFLFFFLAFLIRMFYIFFFINKKLIHAKF